MRRWRRGMLVVAAAAALTACGGDSEPDATPETVEPYTTTTALEGLSLAEWQEASGEICETYNPRAAAASGRLDAAATNEEIVAAFNELLVVTGEYVGALRGVPVPPEVHRAVEDLYERLDRETAGIDALRSSLFRGDYGSIPTSLALLRNYADTGDLYAALGVEACVGRSTA